MFNKIEVKIYYGGESVEILYTLKIVFLSLQSPTLLVDIQFKSKFREDNAYNRSRRRHKPVNSHGGASFASESWQERYVLFPIRLAAARSFFREGQGDVGNV